MLSVIITTEFLCSITIQKDLIQWRIHAFWNRKSEAAPWPKADAAYVARTLGNIAVDDEGGRLGCAKSACAPLKRVPAQEKPCPRLAAIPMAAAQDKSCDFDCYVALQEQIVLKKICQICGSTAALSLVMCWQKGVTLCLFV